METKKKCLYATLDVAKSASQDQIKTAYKKLALVITFSYLQCLEMASRQAQRRRQRKSN